MAERKYRINLQSPEFPLISEDFGRTIMGKPREESAMEDNEPKVYYGHNILPSKQGYDSVAYKEIVSAVTPADTFLDEVIEIKGNARSRLYLAWNLTGEVYVLKPDSYSWTKLPATVPATAHVGFSTDEITFGNVNGISYIYYIGVGAFIYNETTDTLDNVVLSGLSIPDILGISSSSGYLIAFTQTAVAWSSTIDPTDFVPSAITGAGGGSVADIRGSIKFIFSNSLGLLIYSETNTVAATYTGNTQFPFKFREVDHSKGGVSPDLIAYNTNAAEQFIFSRGGLQVITSQRAKTILPEVTDFLLGDRLEDFDTTTLQFTYTDLSSPMLIKIKFLASRYLVISYGATSLTHAIVYDTALERMGKLKINHTYCFAYASSADEIAKESIAFLQNDGSVQVIEVNPSTEPDGVLLLGKFQFIRSRFITLQELALEKVKLNETLTVYDGYSLDGKNLVFEEGYLKYSATNLKEYSFHRTAADHSILLVGAFRLVSALLTYSIHGSR